MLSKIRKRREAAGMGESKHIFTPNNVCVMLIYKDIDSWTRNRRRHGLRSYLIIECLPHNRGSLSKGIVPLFVSKTLLQLNPTRLREKRIYQRTICTRQDCRPRLWGSSVPPRWRIEGIQHKHINAVINLLFNFFLTRILLFLIQKRMPRRIRRRFC